MTRIKEDDESYPIKKGDYYYFVRLEKDKYYPIYFLRTNFFDFQRKYLFFNFTLTRTF